MKSQDIQRGKSTVSGSSQPQPQPPEPESRVLNFDPNSSMNSIQALLTGNWVRPGMILEIPYWGFRVPITQENIESFKADVNQWVSSMINRGLINYWTGSQRTFLGDMMAFQRLKNVFKRHMPEHANMGWWEALFG